LVLTQPITVNSTQERQENNEHSLHRRQENNEHSLHRT